MWLRLPFQHCTIEIRSRPRMANLDTGATSKQSWKGSPQCKGGREGSSQDRAAGQANLIPACSGPGEVILVVSSFNINY